jgi:hypothetical protein
MDTGKGFSLFMKWVTFWRTSKDKHLKCQSQVHNCKNSAGEVGFCVLYLHESDIVCMCLEAAPKNLSAFRQWNMPLINEHQGEAATLLVNNTIHIF